MEDQPPFDSGDEPGSAADSGTTHTRLLCELCLQLLPVDGASVVVRSGLDHRELVHATDPVVARLDDLQFVAGDGPCRDAYRYRFPVLEGDLARDAASDRWPGFAREATALGVAAVFAFPLQVGSIPFGVLELYRTSPGELSPAEVATALLIVDDVVRVVLQELGGLRLSPSPGHPKPAFGSAEVPQATGMVAVQLDVAIPEALAQLRATAFAQNRALQAVAEDIIAGRLTFARS